MIKKLLESYKKSDYFTNPGSGIKDTYKGKVDKSGKLIVEKVGEFNLYEYIQSFADSCDINVLIKRYVNGDTSALNQRVGDYLDITNMPTTFADMLNAVNHGTDIFNGLPTDIREKFNNNVNEFIASIGTDEWNTKLGVKLNGQEQVNEIIDEDVSTTSE